MAPNISGTAIPHPFNTRRGTHWLRPLPPHTTTLQGKGQVFNIYISRWRQHKNMKYKFKKKWSTKSAPPWNCQQKKCMYWKASTSLTRNSDMVTWCINWRRLLALIIFQRSFIEIISHYKKIGYNINLLQQTACLVVNPITVGNFAFLFNCTPVGRTSDSMTVPT